MARTTTRPKGYHDWTPNEDTQLVLDQVQEVLDQYRSYGAMTARQIFYRLVGSYGFPKTEKDYKRLASYLVKARRAGIIEFYDIRDDGTVQEGGGGYPNINTFWWMMEHSAKRYTLDKQLEQPYELELWCEAAGMAGMLADMVSPWNIPVYSTGGFSSVTVTHETAQRIARRERPTVMLHIGDYDPSGESIFRSMAQDIGAFVRDEINAEWVYEDGGVPNPDYSAEEEDWFIPRRVLMTAEIARAYDLPTAPPKSTDSRSASWQGGTVQAEAMAPDQMERIIRRVVAEYIDLSILERVTAREREDKKQIMDVVNKALGRNQ